MGAAENKLLALTRAPAATLSIRICAEIAQRSTFLRQCTPLHMRYLHSGRSGSVAASVCLGVTLTPQIYVVQPTRTLPSLSGERCPGPTFRKNGYSASLRRGIYDGRFGECVELSWAVVRLLVQPRCAILCCKMGVPKKQFLFFIFFRARIGAQLGHHASPADVPLLCWRSHTPTHRWSCSERF